ncbi:SDR family oxidoreductase [Nocardia brasiliensis]|uniref:SDR family oxidoreductase n=1 Tax=Nocardia brasiliensis TaxID=37326 RepID=UPI00366DD477
MAEPTVAITGATGFLGIHLVPELLRRHAGLTVLARGAPKSVLARLIGLLRLTGGRCDELAERVRVVQVDPVRPRLGLSETRFRELADELQVIWHCAGDTTLAAPLEQLRQINVTGTRHVLELAAAGTQRPLVCHTSSVGVAGARRHGTIPEQRQDDTCGFENPYERSKYEAETVVHEWFAEHARPVIVFRPSVLITDLPRRPEFPKHTLSFVAEAIESGMTGFGLDPRSPNTPRLPVRIPGDPTASINLVPVDHAAATMARLADRAPSGGIDTYHVVHYRNTLIADMLTAFQRTYPVDAHLVPRPPDDQSPLEGLLREQTAFLGYARHHRRYDDSRVRAALGPPTPASDIDLNYLQSAIRPE